MFAAKVHKSPLNSTASAAADGDFFGFFSTLAQLLLKASKLTEQTIFAANQKAPHQSACVEEKP